MKAESLIFDIDGTLWDSRALVAEGYNIQLRREGLDHLCVTAEDLRPLFGKVDEEIADVLYPEIPRPERYALQERCAETEREFLRTHPCQVGYPGVRQTLEALSRNHRLFIVSNSLSGYPELCMEKLGLTDLITATLCHGDTGLDKGSTLKILMARQGIQSACYIGDTQADYEATQIAGLPFVWAAYGFGTPESWDGKVDSFRQLAEMF